MTGVLHRVVLYGTPARRIGLPADVECLAVTRVDEVMGPALILAGPGDVVPVLREKVQPALDLLKQLGARPVSSVRIGRLADREQLVVT